MNTENVLSNDLLEALNTKLDLVKKLHDIDANLRYFGSYFAGDWQDNVSLLRIMFSALTKNADKSWVLAHNNEYGIVQVNNEHNENQVLYFVRVTVDRTRFHFCNMELKLL